MQKKMVDIHLSLRILCFSSGWNYTEKYPKRIPKIVENLKRHCF